MKKRYFDLVFISCCAMCLCLASCKPAGNSSSSAAATDTVHSNNVSSSAAEDTETYMLPSPMQIGVIFKRAGLAYLPGLTNEPSNISKYDSKYTQALNLGIYGADLTYCVLNKQSEDAMTYMKTLRALADKLGFGSVFEVDNMAKRFEANLSSEDSLTEITSDLQMETDTYLGANGEKYVGAISFAGAWIESMYIGAKVYTAKSNDKISDRISEQMTILGNLVKSLNSYSKQEAHISNLVHSLNEVENSYNSFQEVKNTANGEEQPKLTGDHIIQLSKQIEDLRQQFIS